MRFDLGAAHVDLDRASITDADRTQALTDTEVALLRHLMRHSDRPVPRDELLTRVWGYNDRVVSRAVDTCVRRLRRKIEPDPRSPVFLVTTRGEGYQLLGARRQADAAAPAVPRPRGDFVGRAEILERLRGALERPGLVALVGPPGVGKTRTALEIAGAWPGACWCAMAPAQHPDGAAVALGRALGLASSGEREIADALAARSGLIALDNLEQLLPALSDRLGGWLRANPELRWLVTSRGRAGLPGERVIRLGAMTAAEGARLFLERARDADGLVDPEEDAAPLERLVERLDGLPLALELAAARTSLFTVSDMLDQLDRRFEILDGGPSPGGLAAAMEGVWRSLSEGERGTLSACAMFADAFTVARVVARRGEGALGDLGRLRERGLLVPERRSSRAHFRLLESLRDHVLAQLRASGALAAARAAHDAAAREEGAQALEAVRDGGAIAPLMALEHDLLQALERAIPGEPLAAAALASTLFALWLERRAPDEIAAVMRRVQALPLPDDVGGRVDMELAVAERRRGDWEAALRLMERPARVPALTHRVALMKLKLAARQRPLPALAADLETLCERAEADGDFYTASEAAAGVAFVSGEPARAVPWQDRAVRLAQRSRDPAFVANTRQRRAVSLVEIGAPLAEIEEDFLAVERAARDLELVDQTLALENDRGRVYTIRGEWEKAAAALDRAIALSGRMQISDRYVHARVNRAIVEMLRRNLDGARELLEEAWWQACRSRTPRLLLIVHVNQAMVEMEAADWVAVADALDEAERHAESVRDPSFGASLRGCGGLLAWSRGELDAARAALREASEGARRIRLRRYAAYYGALAAILGGSTEHLEADAAWARRIHDVSVQRALAAAGAIALPGPARAEAARVFAALDDFEPETVALVRRAAAGESVEAHQGASLLAQLVAWASRSAG